MQITHWHDAHYHTMHNAYRETLALCSTQNWTLVYTEQFNLQNYDLQSCAPCRTGPHKWLWAILLQIGPAIGGSQLTRSGTVAVDVEVVVWIEHKCGGGFLSKKLHLEAPLPASEPASSKLKVCQLTVQGSSPPGQTSCFAAFGEQGFTANPVSGYLRKMISHISRLDNEYHFHGPGKQQLTHENLILCFHLGKWNCCNCQLLTFKNL